MKSHFMKAFGTAILGLTLLLGLGMTPGKTAQAQNQDDRYRRDQGRARDDGRDRNDRGRGRNWDGYPNWGGTFQLRQTALNAGYNEGIKQGRDDVRHRRNYDFQR